MESQESLLFKHMLPVKIPPAIPKPWQVEHEINNKIGFTFFAEFLLNRFKYAAYHLKEETLGFLSMYKTKGPTI